MDVEDAPSAADLQTEVDSLRQQLESTRGERDALQGERERYRKLYLELIEKVAMLERGFRGQSRERFTDVDKQMSIFILGQLLGQQADDATAAPDESDEPEMPTDPKGDSGPRPEKNKPGRRPLPEDLPRVDIELVPEDVKRDGLDAFTRVGQEVSETVERRTASLVVVRVTRPKFVRNDRDRDAPTEFLVAPAQDLPIERGLAGPNFLAETVTLRFEDHMPANRLHKRYKREGFDIVRSTLCRMHINLANLCAPLIKAMWADAMAKAPYLCTDATGVMVQAKKKCEHGHFWVVIAPELHVLFRFTHDHNAMAVDSLISVYGYEGVLVSDAHSVFAHLYEDGTIVKAGCWAHCRRYFLKTLSSEPERAKEAIVLIAKLFEIERDLKHATPKRRKSARKQRAGPVVDAFYKWCAKQSDYAIEQSPLHRALTYATNQRDALERFLVDGRIPIHNNDSERALRRDAVGRKNWLFIGNDAGATANTTFVTLLASCQMHDIEPQGYLRDLFCLLPNWPQRRVLELAPAYWKQTLEQAKTHELLAANPFRRVALGDLQAHTA